METLLGPNPFSVVSGVEGSGLVLIGTGLLSYVLACTVAFFFLLEFWNNNKHELKKWLRGENYHGTHSTEMETGSVGGLEMIPGPTPVFWKFIGNLFQCLPVNETLNIFQRFSKKYGNVFKIEGAYEVIVFLNSPDMIQAMLKSTSFDHVTKAPIVYDLMKPFITNGVLVSKGKFWQKERKILQRSMSFQSLRSYISLLNKHCERFVKVLEKRFADGQVHPINEEINASFLEVICEMITGFDINGTNEGVEYHHNFEMWKETIAYRLTHPWFVPNIVWRLTPMAWKTNKAVERLFAFARRRISEHRQKLAAVQLKNQNKNNNDLNPKDEAGMQDEKPFRSVLDELVDAEVDDDQIVDEVNTMLFGGHETGASTVHFFCFMMALHPEFQMECRREADEVFENSMFTTNGRLSYDAVGNLKYIERCLLETLRLYPPVWAFLRELNAPLRVKINEKDVDIPVGSNVCICSYILHRTEELYPNPDEFNPDRFLPEECANRQAYSFVPFSGGPRNCLGLKFGMIEMKMVAAYLVRNFTITSTDKLEDVVLLPHLTLTPERDYNFIFERRHLATT